jgi:hypothetical protein
MIAPWSRVFGRGDLVIQPHKIASRRYLWRTFWFDLVTALPQPQVKLARCMVSAVCEIFLACMQFVIWIVVRKMKESRPEEHPLVQHRLPVPPTTIPNLSALSADRHGDWGHDGEIAFASHPRSRVGALFGLLIGNMQAILKIAVVDHHKKSIYL